MNRKIILGSTSPRRQQLLRELFGDIEVVVKNTKEDFPSSLREAAIPLFLAEQKANAYHGELKENDILITADTIVWFKDHVLNKPGDKAEALSMLKKLSGKVHKVFTGVSITRGSLSISFSAESEVEFIPASEQELINYIDTCNPYDKAGSYGAQECLPDGMNPLSEKEKRFLAMIGKEDLFQKTLGIKTNSHVPLIKNIKGSYFNVMGLPLVELMDVFEKHRI